MARQCNVCYGRKKVMGLGCMETDCSTCLGVGYLVDEMDQQALKNLSSVVVPAVVMGTADSKKAAVKPEKTEKNK